MSLERGLELFNAGRFWDAHEAWEESWMPDRHGPDGDFYKGLIQLAAGYLHASRRNRRGALNKLRGGAGYLERYRPNHLGVDVESAVTAALAAAAEIETGASWPPPPPLTASR